MNLKRKVRMWRLRRMVRLDIRLHAWFDAILRQTHWPNWRIQQFWRDYIKSPRAREFQLKALEALVSRPPRRKIRRPAPPPRVVKTPGPAKMALPVIPQKEVKNDR